MPHAAFLGSSSPPSPLLGEAPSNPGVAFHGFQLLAAERRLLENGRPVRIGGRALDLLILLVERAGEVVGKDELVARAWPDTTVVEANLAVHVRTLRQALGDGTDGRRFILTEPGRGYRFVAPIITPPSAPPVGVSRLVGREGLITTIVDRLRRERLVTLLGPAGVGKTATALAASRQAEQSLGLEVRLVELAAVEDPVQLPVSLANQLGLEPAQARTWEQIGASLQARPTLLLIDNCEHLIEPVAAMTASLLRAVPTLRVMATSRESLRLRGEQTLRLSGLGVPEQGLALSAAQALAYPAVALLVSRITAAHSGFTFRDEDSRAAAEICRRLDGLPLAIELVAPRVEVFGLAGLAASLSERLEPGVLARRGAPPRHRTLSAALDWSFELLQSCERDMLEALSVFIGAFSIQAAEAVCDPFCPGEAPERLLDLTRKSLVVAHGDGRFQLLETTRRFAAAKLAEKGPAEAVRRRHAAFFAGQEALGREDLENLRAAMTFVLGPFGDRAQASALTRQVSRLLIDLRLFDEARQWTRRALAVLQDSAPTDPVIRYALGFAELQVVGATEEAADHLSAAVDLAKGESLRTLRLQSFVALAMTRHRQARLDEARTLTGEARDLAHELGRIEALTLVDALASAAEGGAGNLSTAFDLAQRACGRVQSATGPAASWGLDAATWAQVARANVLWSVGRADEALLNATRAAEQATNHPASLAFALALCEAPIRLGVDDPQATLACLERLKSAALTAGLERCLDLAQAYEALMRARAGELETAEHDLSAALDRLGARGEELVRRALLAALAGIQVSRGRLDEGLATVQEGLQATSAPGWLGRADLLRVRASIASIRQGSSSAGEDDLRQGLAEAEASGAQFEALRCAADLARRQARSGALDLACAELDPVVSRISGGDRVRDLRKARELLQRWRKVLVN
ncbi:ATP-binding protein [Caulobacter segnis]|uniref:ATP-binding protein n=1 Tax=Caulobacter segnis TaxID=88688 RepID=UPI001CC06101|nr:winged helix-turn-helix domain-containing protein [Caulobacter segnis]